MLDGEAVATAIMVAIALPFLAAFLMDRTRIWGLLVAFILTAAGLVPLIASVPGNSEVIGSFVLIAIALPFWAAFLLSSRSWWAVIPAGILTSVSILVYLTSNNLVDTIGFSLVNGIFCLGIAGTFFLVWLRRNSYPVDWAKYPASLFFLGGLFSILIGASMSMFWPVLLIAAGVMILVLGLRPRHA
jgi:hypothetical protein